MRLVTTERKHTWESRFRESLRRWLDADPCRDCENFEAEELHEQTTGACVRAMEEAGCDWFNEGGIQETMGLVVARRLGVHMERLAWELTQSLSEAHSPIERIFLLALLEASWEFAPRAQVRLYDDKFFQFARFENGGGRGMLTIEPQKQIGDHRVDFKITLYTAREYPVYRREDGTGEGNKVAFSSVLVELDGHDYHERTKAQASSDKKRDRTLQKQGFQVFRYSGSDVWADVVGHASEVLEYLYKKNRTWTHGS